MPKETSSNPEQQPLRPRSSARKRGQYRPFIPVTKDGDFGLAPFEPADASAVQAIIRGNASEEQQRRGMDFIIQKLCKTYDQTYFPEHVRDTDFAEGKRYVGLQLVMLGNLNITRYIGKPEGEQW